MLRLAREWWYKRIPIRTHAGLFRSFPKQRRPVCFPFGPYAFLFSHILAQRTPSGNRHAVTLHTQGHQQETGRKIFLLLDPFSTACSPGSLGCGCVLGSFCKTLGKTKLASLFSLLPLSSIVALLSCGMGLGSPLDAKICKDPTDGRRSALRHEVCERRAALDGGESPRNKGQRRGMAIQMLPAGACLLALPSLCSAVQPLCLPDHTHGVVVRQENGIDVIQVGQRHTRDSLVA